MIKMNNFIQTLIIGVIIFCSIITRICGIINGRDPKLGEVKYVVAFADGRLCSGGIIGDKYILTAAHCIKFVKNDQFKPVKIVAATNSTKEYNTKVSIVKWVRRVFVPVEFAKYPNTYDIAVLELSGSIQIEKNSHKLQKLELPTPIKRNPLTYPNYVGKEFKAAGFGSRTVKFVTAKNGTIIPKTSDGGSLQVAKAAVIDTATCEKIYPKKPMANCMCSVVIENPRKDTFQGFCYGDSGTPIVVDDNIVIGVFVASDSCNSSKDPDISIKTTNFMSFINNAMNYNGTDIPDIKVYSAL